MEFGHRISEVTWLGDRNVRFEMELIEQINHGVYGCTSGVIELEVIYTVWSSDPILLGWYTQ